jgi:hypothetical protein
VGPWPIFILFFLEGNVNNAFSTCVSAGQCASRENNSLRDGSLRLAKMNSMLRRAETWARGMALVAGALTVMSPLAVFAQSGTVAARVTERIDVSKLVTLRGNTHALARAQNDQGAAPPDLPMNRIMLVLKRSAEQESALQNLLTQQQVNGSPSYHQWLTPDQFGQQFGPADSDIQAVTSWLASYGFQSIKVSRGRTVIEFSGTAAQVAAGLHTSIHKYLVNGESHWGNASDPQIPAALAPVVAGFASLHNFPKRASSSRSTQVAKLTTDSNGTPQITFTDNSHGLAPADFNTIYNINPATMTGAGVTIGVIARTNIIPQDVADFRSTFGLTPNPPTIILNGPDPTDLGGGEEAEAVLDATWSGAVAPAATVKLVVSEPTNSAAGEDLSEFYIIDNNLADVMTESFSVCEAAFFQNGVDSLDGPTGAAAFYSGMAEEAAAQGITYTVASGDSGPDGCASPSALAASGSGASVNLLASTPFTTAVGGTEFHDCDPLPGCNENSGTYWNALNAPTTRGSAKSYIPENVWNESCSVAQCGASFAGLWSSGGGASIAFGKPSWQAGVVGIPAANARFLPDVSMAAAGHDGYALCLDASCQASSPGGPGFAILSGTSASAQVFGGVMALVDQKMGGRVGVANYALYKLAATEPPTSPTNPTTCNASTPPASTCIFNDVTVGNTNLTFVGETGFSAAIAAGYDEATGLGSVNVSNLVNNWHTAITSATTSTLTLNNGTAVSITHGASVPVSVVVAPVPPATGTPTGDVSLIATSATDQGVDDFRLTAGSANWSTTLLPGGGPYQVHAHYGGDGTFLGSDSSPASVTVMPEASQITFGIVVSNGTSCSTVPSLTYGSAYVLTATVADVHASSTPCSPNESGSSPTGIVTLSDTVNATTSALDGGTFKLNSFGEVEDQTIQLTAGMHTIKASYLGDPSFAPSGPVSAVVNVSKAPTTTSVSASQTTVAAGASVTLTATVGTTSNATANSSQEPSGTVQFFVNGTPLGSAVTVSGGVNPNTLFAQATAQFSSTTLANGADVITAQYSGDGNYSPSAISPSVTVNVGTSGVNVSTGCASSTITIASPGQSASCLITVTGANNFSGTMTLACGISNSPASASDLPGCSFGAPDSSFTTPGTITLSTSSETGTATLTVTSTAASHLLAPPSSRRQGPNWLLVSEIGAALACMFLMALATRKRRGAITFAAVLFLATAVVTGCSGGNNSGTGGTGNPGTTIGAYTITVKVTPTGGTATSVPITVNVN